MGCGEWTSGARIYGTLSSCDVCVCVSAGGSRVISRSDDQSVQVWDVESRRVERVLEGHRGVVTSVSMSADGQRVISGSNDQSVRVWNVESGRVERVSEGHCRRVTSESMSAAGQRLISGSRKCVRVWDVETWRVDEWSACLRDIVES